MVTFDWNRWSPWPGARTLALLNVLLLLTIFSRRIKLWPAPHNGCWQSYVFWPLFRGGLGLTLLAGALAFAARQDVSYGFWLAGLPMLLAGAGFLIYGFVNLGIEQTYCGEKGLVTGGLYRYSRNPQYVASIVAFTGLAIAAHSPALLALCALAALVYVLMPYAEEPWLLAAYGDAYRKYQAATPRFIGMQPLRHNSRAEGRSS